MRVFFSCGGASKKRGLRIFGGARRFTERVTESDIFLGISFLEDGRDDKGA